MQQISSTNQRTVLVADDNAESRETFRSTLQGSGYKVVTATDGIRALYLAGRQPLDAAVVELVMPEEDGIQAIRKLRKANPGVKIIAVAAPVYVDALQAARHLGANASLIKPIRSVTLLRVLDTLLEKTP